MTKSPWENEEMVRLSLSSIDRKFLLGTAQEVDFLEQELGLHPGARVLDLGCGAGRHSIEFARRGYEVTGVDISPLMLEAAEKRAAEAGVSVEFICMDLAELGPRFTADAGFDAAICLCESGLSVLGERKDSEFLRNVFRLLKPGAGLIVTGFNAIRRYRSPGSVFEFMTGIVHWSMPVNDGKETLREDIRVYTPSELQLMLDLAGFRDVQVYGCSPGGFGRQTLEMDAIEMMAVAFRPDVKPGREFLFPLLDLANAADVLDIGCGKGHDLVCIGRLAGTETRLVGIDSSRERVDAAAELVSGDPRYAFVVHDVSTGLPFEDESFDLVYSMNLLECISDKDALVREVHRVLRPGGQVVFAHHDWDSMLIDGADKDLVRKIVHTFGDWKQAWMTDCDSWMGRRLWRTFNGRGLFTGTVHVHPVVETEFSPGKTGYEYIKDFEALVRREMIAQEEYDRFIHDIEDLASKDQYCYSISLFAYAGRKA